RAALPGLRRADRAADGGGDPALLHRVRSPAAARHGVPPVHRGRPGRPVVVYGDGGQTREFTYVDDVVRASLLAMTAPVEVEAVNVGGGRRGTPDPALGLVGARD